MTMFALGIGMLLGILGVLLIDTVGAAASRVLRFDYGFLIPLQVMVWTLSALIASHGSVHSGEALIRGATACLVVGVVDSTLGWRLSLRIHPGLAARMPPEALLPRGMRITALRCTALATGIGGMAAMLFHR